MKPTAISDMEIEESIDWQDFAGELSMALNHALLATTGKNPGEFETPMQAAQTIAIVATENRLLREILWIRHGCGIAALYGDDGELQCGKCLIDFKRDHVELIRRRFAELNRPEIECSQAETKQE